VCLNARARHFDDVDEQSAEQPRKGVVANVDGLNLCVGQRIDGTERAEKRYARPNNALSVSASSARPWVWPTSRRTWRSAWANAWAEA
jgi:hypothetical protein